MDDISRWALVAIHFTLRLFGEGALFLWRLLLDALAGGRTWWLRRAVQRAPSHAADIEAQFARLREAHAARWAPAALQRTAFAPRTPGHQSTTRVRDARPSAGAVRWTQAQEPDEVATAFTTDATQSPPGVWVVAGGRSAAAVLTPGPLGTWDDFKSDSPVVIRTRDGFRMGAAGGRSVGETNSARPHGPTRNRVRYTTESSK